MVVARGVCIPKCSYLCLGHLGYSPFPAFGSVQACAPGAALKTVAASLAVPSSAWVLLTPPHSLLVLTGLCVRGEVTCNPGGWGGLASGRLVAQAGQGWKGLNI